MVDIKKTYKPEELINKSINERIELVESIYIGYPRFKDILTKIKYCHETSKFSANPQCLLVTGCTGSGKTTLIKQYKSQFEVELTEEGVKQPVLHATTPCPSTNKGMIQKMLLAMDDPFAYSRSTTDQTIRLIKLLRDRQVELIILDEFQHFADSDNKKIRMTVSDWLKTLIVETRIPVVLFGLPIAEQIINANEQLSRRFSFRQNIDSFTFDASHSVKEFISCLAAIETQLPLIEESNLWQVDMAYRIFYATDGTMGYIMELLRKATYLAVKFGEESLTLEILADAFNQFIQKDKPGKINPFMQESFTEEDAKKHTKTVGRPDHRGVSKRLNRYRFREESAKDVM